MKPHLLPLPLILLCLIMAIWSGWTRVGWQLPLTAPAAHHGALMVNSFLASLIFLERAAALKNKWMLAIPVVNALSLIFFLMKLPTIASLLFTTGSFCFVLLCIHFLVSYKELYYAVFLAGALSLLTGNIILLTSFSYPTVVPWWMAFLLNIIVAERLELTRFLQLTALKKNLLVAALAFNVIGLIWPFQHPEYWMALGMIGTAAWLLRYDMARHSIRIPGQHRYSALLLMTGYVWLIISGLLIFLAFGRQQFYDAIVHAFFIGFVFSMIFSHAPIIFPAVARIALKLYRPVLYTWFAGLQFTLLIRITGDLQMHAEIKKAGAISNGFVILLFFINMALIVRKELIKKKQSIKP